MRTLALGILGIFGLGLAVGSFVAATTAGEAPDPMGVEGALSVAPLVDCGAGREALVEQAIENGEIVARVKCVPTQPAPIVRATPAPVVTAERVPEARSDAPVAKPEANEDEGSRSLKDSALIIGGAAGAGAGIGAIAKGKKGAAVGAAAGAVAGTVYDLVTRKKKNK
jgi:hypothetical protein